MKARSEADLSGIKFSLDAIAGIKKIRELTGPLRFLSVARHCRNISQFFENVGHLTYIEGYGLTETSPTSHVILDNYKLGTG